MRARVRRAVVDVDAAGRSLVRGEASKLLHDRIDRGVGRAPHLAHAVAVARAADGDAAGLQLQLMGLDRLALTAVAGALDPGVELLVVGAAAISRVLLVLVPDGMRG